MKENSIVKEPLPNFLTDDSQMKIYPSNKMTIFKSEGPTHVLKGEHSHTNYEFIIACSPIEGFILDGRRVDFLPNQMVAVHSEQKHGTHLLITGIEFINIQFEREFFQEIMYAVYKSKTIVIKQDVVTSDETFNDLIRQYISEYERKHSGYLLILEQLSVTIAVRLLRMLVNHEPVMQADVDAIIDSMKKNLESVFSLDTISFQHNMSKSSMIRKFKESTGMTPYDYFLELKIAKSLGLLNEPNNKVIEVALQCGFNNHSHFSKVFKKATGLTPTEYRERVLLMRK